MPIIAPMLLIMVLAISVVILAVGLAIQRTNDLALEHERELVSRAILDHSDRLLRRVSTIAIADGWANSVVPNLNQLWLYEHLGTKLSSSLESDFTLVVDPQDRIVFGLESLMVLSQQMLESERAGFDSVIDELRHRLVHDTDAGRALGPTAAEFAASKGRTVRIGSFKGHAAIVAAATVSPGSRDAALPKGPAPILITINLIDQTFVARIGEKLKLTDIRAEGGRVPDPGQQTLPLVGLGNHVVEHLVWTPQRVSTDIWTYAAVILAVALGGLLALACFSMFYIRRASERLRSGEDQLRHLAHHDSLSGLPNRMFFSAKLDEVIATVNRDDGTAAVFCVDLDHFKDVNDTLGHHIGDELIRAVTNRLQRIFLEDAIVGRLGGDEFAVITTGAIGLDQVMAQADQIIGFLCAPYTLKGHMIVIGASIGIAVIERDLGNAGDFMRFADLALYRAKNDGRNRACIYDNEMVADLKRRKEMEYDLRAAIENQQLSVAYQPIVSPDGETIRGVEALCRWKHASRGDVSPSDFIPIAEESGLINTLGEWMLKSACMEAAAWPDMLLSVNVSSLQFRRPDFVEMVQSVLAQTKFDPNRLELELTESMLIGNVDAAESAMRHLKALGIKLALDDFGTGYSSLHYLRRFPFDKLKIDGSFVRNIESGADSAAIVHAVVSLGRGLGMKVTAEGVETVEQHLFLRAAGVHFLQGFLFSRPVSGEAITRRLSPQNRKTA